MPQVFLLDKVKKIVEHIDYYTKAYGMTWAKMNLAEKILVTALLVIGVGQVTIGILILKSF